MNTKNLTIREYLTQKNVSFREANGELIVKCLLSDCDKDSRGNEAHMYFDEATGQYDCKKCGEKGNLITLAKRLGDLKPRINQSGGSSSRSRVNLNPSDVERCNREMPERIRKYLNERGITDDFIKNHALGYGTFYGKKWITIPIRDESGKFSFFKLRRDPEDDANPDKSKMFPFGKEAEIYGWDTLREVSEKVVICEGEFDRLILLSKGIPAVTSTGGAGTFKKDWLFKFAHVNNVYVCYDNDKAGKDGAERVLQSLMSNERFDMQLYKIDLPEEVGEGGDITDYFVKLDGNADDLFTKYAHEYPERPEIDTSNFKPMSSEELVDILGLTIKKDETNKIITFLAELSAFTEDSQINITFIAPSSTGKSYIPVETSTVFPTKDVMIVAYCSPTAFFHDNGKYLPEKDEYLVDLSRKVLIFLDQPHTLLLQHLRPLLSHDQKELNLKITDKNQRGGNRTKNIRLRGYPAVIFCTAGLKLDEQEATRFLLLSPETNQEKIREGIVLKIRKEADLGAYKAWLNSDERRTLLKQRIEAIKQTGIADIKLASPDKIAEIFFQKRATLKPKHQRDIGRIIAIAKCIALLNLWWRERQGATIIATDEDIDEAFKIWDEIAESQELNIPPYLYNFYYEIVLAAWKEKSEVLDEFGDKPKNVALTKKDITKKHLQVYGRIITDWFLRTQVLPVLENAGLIGLEKDPSDKRYVLIFPLVGLDQPDEINSEEGGGVKDEIEHEIL